MLPNHAPLVIAEQFGTLESLFPGASTSASGARRAPISSPRARLRRQPGLGRRRVPAGRARADGVLRAAGARAGVRAIPGDGLQRADLDPRLEPVRRAARGGARPAVRVRLALRAGADDAGDRALSRRLPAFGQLERAVRDARASTCSRPTPTTRRSCSRPRCSRRSSTCAAAARRACQPPVAGYAERLAPAARALLAEVLSCSAIGSPDSVRNALRDLIARTAADELMLTCNVFDHAQRLRSLEIAASVRDTLD